MAFVLEENVHTTLAAGVSGGATSIDVNKASSPWNDPPDPGGDTSPLVLTDSTSSPGKIEIITYTSRADNGDGTWTLGGVTKNAYGGHGDQSWNSGDIVIQAPTATHAEATQPQTYAGDPNGTLAADFTGQIAFDTSTTPWTRYVATAADGTVAGTSWQAGLQTDSNGVAMLNI